MTGEFWGQIVVLVGRAPRDTVRWRIVGGNSLGVGHALPGALGTSELSVKAPIQQGSSSAGYSPLARAAYRVSRCARTIRLPKNSISGIVRLDPATHSQMTVN